MVIDFILRKSIISAVASTLLLVSSAEQSSNQLTLFVQKEVYKHYIHHFI
jgi:hypothetical protein